MQLFRNAVTVLLAVAFVSMSCGGTSSKVTFPTGGANGANAAVTPDNADDVFGEVFGEIFSLGFGVGKPIATKPIQSGKIDQTINGDHSGTARLKGSATVSGQNITYNGTVTLTNFSNDGVQFHQGSLTIKLTVISQSSFAYTYKGTVNTQGAYKAIMVFDIAFNGSASTGTVKITSNGQTFTYNVANDDAN